MKLISVAGYDATGLIEAVFDEADEGQPPDLHTRFCLDDPQHTYRQLIAAWEAAGNTIPPYVEPTEQRLARVDAERDRRTDAGFAFGGKVIQSRPDDQLKITGAATAATIAVAVGGKQAGDLRWSDPNADFVWIAADNTTLSMDAPTTIQFGQAALAHVAAFVFAARSIKDRIIAGEDLDPADDALWPGTE